MRRAIFILSILLITVGFSMAQQITNIANFQPELNYENVHVYELDSDPLASTYMIWVKNEVAEHFHAEHTEIAYVLEGKGVMTNDHRGYKVRDRTR